MASPFAFLPAGIFQGDLLIADVQDDEKDASRSRVLRAMEPDFTSVQEFIPAHNDSETGKPFSPYGLALNSKGDVFILDFFNDKVLRYGTDGTFKDIFARIEGPSAIAIGSDDTVYVSTFGRGTLYIFDQLGTPITKTTGITDLFGVTICTPR